MDKSQSQGLTNGHIFRCYQVVPYPPERVFEAFARPELLARWWGPDGFTNTFEVFEFAVGGRWKFEMHGPNGSHNANENVFLDLKAPSAVVIHHVSQPRYVLTVTLAARAGGTAIEWTQEFEDAAVADRIRHIVEPANEQNLNRLQSVLANEARHLPNGQRPTDLGDRPQSPDARCP
jgi:uncharacterized protein YndB with AHSA1/START domain